MPAEDSPVVVRVPSDGAAFAQAVNAAAADGRADVVLLAEEIDAAPDVAARLLAAGADSTVATVSAMHRGGPWDPAPLSDLADAGGAARGRRPRIAAPSGGCVLVRRWALDLAGPLDATYATAEGVLADLGARCATRGLSHVLSGEVLVEGPWRWHDASDEARVAATWPHHAALTRMTAAAESPARRMLDALGVRSRRLTVTIDGRSLGPYRAGTQVHALELVAALARTERVDVRVLVAADLDPEAAEAFTAHDAVTTLTYEEAAHGTPEPTDVVHRPAQVFTPDDLALLVPLGRRLVISHQDLIAFRTPGLHASPADWERFRRTTRVALGAADHVCFFSEHAFTDALTEDLVEAERASVIPIGVDHQAVASVAAARPAALAASGRPFLLTLGADLPHKNVAFAVRVLDALRASGWDGELVLAGPGSDRAEPHPHVVALGGVGEAEKAWLLGHAAAVLYPTLYEGFGLIPFEAASAGVPCAFAAVASLAEVLPRELATLVPWDPAASAAAMRRLLDDPAAQVLHLLEAGRRFRWDATAAALVARYEALVAARPSEATAGPRERLALLEELDDERRGRIREWESFRAWRTFVGEDALALVGPDGALSRAEQRALLALASKPLLRRLAIRPMRVAYEAIKSRA